MTTANRTHHAHPPKNQPGATGFSEKTRDSSVKATFSPEFARVAAVPRLALTAMEAPAALGVSHGFFKEHIAPELRWVRRGRKKLVFVAELERWGKENAARVFENAS
jgi:hypothetical protein